MNRRKVCGVGICDADYVVRPIINGKRETCPYFQVWRNMLMRAYSEKFHHTHPTYIDVRVCDDWFLFSNFRSRMKTQDWQGKQLDKDIVQPGNRIYCPEFCCFVSAQVNMMLNKITISRGRWPLSVDYAKRFKKFRAKINFCGKSHQLGLFSSPEEAHDAWAKKKHHFLCEIANHQDNPRIAKGLLLHAHSILEIAS